MVGDYLAAIALGILFQHLAIAPMRGLSLCKGLSAAAKADVLSLTSFEVGLFGWMALMSFVFFPASHHLHPDSPVHWFPMQMVMIIGFFTAWPMNVWLIRHGIKEAMRSEQLPPFGQCRQVGVIGTEFVIVVPVSFTVVSACFTITGTSPTGHDQDDHQHGGDLAESPCDPARGVLVGRC
jgi:hypothetical protein